MRKMFSTFQRFLVQIVHSWKCIWILFPCFPHFNCIFSTFPVQILNHAQSIPKNRPFTFRNYFTWNLKLSLFYSTTSLTQQDSEFDVANSLNFWSRKVWHSHSHKYFIAPSTRNSLICWHQKGENCTEIFFLYSQNTKIALLCTFGRQKRSTFVRPSNNLRYVRMKTFTCTQSNFYGCNKSQTRTITSLSVPVDDFWILLCSV